jgi:signal transduction histidine kinase
MGEAGTPDLKPEGARPARPWSLARRLTTLFLISTSLFVVAISATSAWFLERSFDAEVDSLAKEELDEMQGRLERDAPPPESTMPKEEIEGHWATTEKVKTWVQSLADLHLECRFAWRIWRPGAKDDAPAWADFGETEKLLTAGVPALWPAAPRGRLAHGRLWQRMVTAPSGWRILLVIDASALYRPLREFLTYALVLILASMGVALVYSRFFFVRVSALLGRVASRAREVRSLDEPLAIEVAHAPSEIAAIADALSEMLEKVRRETTQARIFTAGLAHELRSPVQNLVGERDAETYRKVLASHLEELRSLGDAIDNLVTICSAGEAGRTYPRELIDLGEESQIRLARERAQGARHRVRFDLSVEGDTRIWGDREALLRAIRNLVANAIQWSPPNSKVEARVRGLPQELEILVDDAGPGVPPELRQRIFEPFFRGPQATGRRIGYGLGLALTRMAVDEHGGSIEVGVSPLGGARFHMRLPRRAPDSDGSADRSTRLTS